MSSDILMEYPSKDSAKDDLQMMLESKHGFKGPTKLTSLIEPIDFRENSIRDPTCNSNIRVEQHLTPPSDRSNQMKKKSRLIQIPQQPLEESRAELPSKVETFGQTNLVQTTNQVHQGNNLFKIVMAKSYFNQFVDNLLTKSYVRKPYQFSNFVNTLMDDLIYFYKRGKYQKSYMAAICQYFKCVPVFDQSSILVIGWQLLHILTILLIFFWTPYIIGFGINYDAAIFDGLQVKYMEYYFLFSMIFDFIIVTNTTYIDKGIIIKSRRKIVQNYLKSQAIYDLLAFVSLLLALQFDTNISREKFSWQLIPYFVFYLVRLFKLQVKVRKLEEFFNFTGSSQDLVELIKLIFMVVYVGHIFACTWHAVAFYNNSESKNWLQSQNIEDSDNLTKYNFAFYWAVQTMITVGYGDINPQNNFERFFVNVSMFLACGVFAFSFNSIGLMLSNLNSRQDLYKRSTNLLNSFMTKNQIKTELQSRIRNYYDYIFQEEQEINDEEVRAITGKLSSPLQDELKYEIRMNVMQMCKGLTRFSNQTLRTLSLQIEEVRFSPDDIILTQNTSDDCALYIITKGKIQILFQDEREDRNTRILSVLQKGQSFGEYAFFTGLNRTAAARSNGFTRAYKITREQFLHIISNNQADYEKFCEIKDNLLLYRNHQPAKLNCYACHKQDHLIKDCPVIHYVADKERILKKELFPMEQERDPKFKRHSLSNYHTLYNMKFLKAVAIEIQTDYNNNNDNSENITVMEGESLGSYIDDDDFEDQQYSQVSKTHTRQQSQKNSLSQDHTLLKPIEESDNSSENLASPVRPRPKTVKQTVTTAGFGGQDSLGGKFINQTMNNESSDAEQSTQQQYQQQAQQAQQSQQMQLIIQNPVRQDEHRFSLKIKEPSIDLRTQQKRQTLLRQQKREESFNNSQLFINSQSIIPFQHDQSRERASSSLNRPNMGSPQEREKKKKSVQTQRTRTQRTLRTQKTHKSTKIDGGQQKSSLQQNQLTLQFFEPPLSMELEDFEAAKVFTYYFPLNNFIEIVKRANRFLQTLYQRRKQWADFSLYTFSFYAKNKAQRMKKKLKNNMDETAQPEQVIMKEKKSIAVKSVALKSNNGGRRPSKRATQQEEIKKLFKKRQTFGTQVQQNPISFNRRTDF